MKTYELDNIKSLVTFLKAQDYNSIVERDRINAMCHDYNLKSENFYSDKFGYFEFATFEMNLDSLFIQYLNANEDSFPTLDMWLAYSEELVVHNYCFDSEEGNYFDYQENKFMFNAVSERILINFYIQQIQKIVTTIDILKVIDLIVDEPSIKTLIFTDININTNSDILFYDCINEEYIDFNICQEGSIKLLMSTILFMTPFNTYTTKHDEITLTHFNNRLIINKLNDRIAIEGFNDIYGNTLYDEGRE